MDLSSIAVKYQMIWIFHVDPVEVLPTSHARGLTAYFLPTYKVSAVLEIGFTASNLAAGVRCEWIGIIKNRFLCRATYVCEY